MKSTLQLLKILLIPLAVLSLTRIIFYLWNIDLYPNISILPFIFGIHFDITTICMLFSPFIFFYFLANHFSFFKKVEAFFFIIAIIIVTALNLIDTGFIEFSQKRSGLELVEFVNSGEEFFQLLPSYIIDFWFLIVTLIAITWGSHKIYRYWRTDFTPKLHYIAHYLLLCGLVILGIRGKIGSFSNRPLDTIDAAKYTQVSFITVVLNTPFCIIKSFEKHLAKPVCFFPENEMTELFNPIKSFPSHKKETNQNIVIIILESFSASYMGTYNNGVGYTPFLDSLIKESLFFPNCFANGTHSAEAIPSIFASIPALIDEGLIFSEYINNKTNSLPESLKKLNYHSAFFHGANNGSMHFDSYSKAIGFDDYFGREEYNNDEHFDGKWGIYDHYFYNYATDKISEFKQPFLASIFSLSSHHPYAIPSELENNFPSGDLEIFKAVAYADWSLSVFFEKAKTQDWYDNTLFVIVADHTSYTRNPTYLKMPGKYRIPLLFFHPKQEQFQSKIDSSLVMQIDLYPSLMEYSGIGDTILAFGNTVFSKQKDGECFFALNNGVYQLLQNNYLLQFDGTKSIAVYDVMTDKRLENNLIDEFDYEKMELKIKAILQQFNNRLIANKLNAD